MTRTLLLASLVCALLVLCSSHTASAGGLLPNIGVCLSGMEYGRVPGRPGPGGDYAWPTADEYQYFHSKQFTIARLPFKSPHSQHNNTQQPVNSSMTGHLLGTVRSPCHSISPMIFPPLAFVVSDGSGCIQL